MPEYEMLVNSHDVPLKKISAVFTFQSINFYSRHRGPYRQHSTDIYINIKQYKTFKNEADKASLKHIQASGPMLPKARCIPCITLRNISYGHNDHILCFSLQYKM